MILLLNNMVYFRSNSQLHLSEMAHDKYPEQDLAFLGKKIHLAYWDTGASIRSDRLDINKNKYPEFKPGRDVPADNCWWRIVRFDKHIVSPQVEEGEEPGYDNADKTRLAILIDNQNRVIVTETDKISGLVYPPFTDYMLEDGEVLLNFADDWDSFNESYNKEPVFIVKSQNDELVGKLVYTEYWQDLSRHSVDDPILIASKDIFMTIPEDQHKSFDKIKEQLLAGNPKLENLPDCILASFPTYYPRHEHTMADIPRRIINPGVIIRCDESGVGAEQSRVVVAEFIGNTVRFVTSDDAFIYYETDTERVNLSELNLFNHKTS